MTNTETYLLVLREKLFQAESELKEPGLRRLFRKRIKSKINFYRSEIKKLEDKKNV